MSQEKLHRFQNMFGNTLSTPFSFLTGEATCQTELYDEDIKTEVQMTPFKNAVQSLTVYNQQYWYRLFKIVQDSFPLLNKLIGPWQLNQLTTSYVKAHPSSSPVLDTLGAELPEYIQMGSWTEGLYPDAAYTKRDLKLLYQAAELENIYNELLYLANVNEMSDSVVSGNPRIKPQVKLYAENWPLLSLRNELDQVKEGIKDIEYKQSHWAICKQNNNIGFYHLATTAYKLMKEIIRFGGLNEGIEHIESVLSVSELKEAEVHLEQWCYQWGKRGWFY
ncbi:MAG: putative DNA-binding domain-containing protein [Fibrobacteria bacterium]|nr:putative DNA-binding domain-containing protein [Fibrobacteria bacterium]